MTDAVRRIFLIIDGYNLMHASGYARPTYGPGDLERCRNRFLRMLHGLLSEQASRNSTVVFDAFDAPGDRSARMQVGEMQVRFAEPGSDADSVIEQMLKTHSAPRQVLVVSSDQRLKRAANRRRARSISSLQFWNQLTDEGHDVPDSRDIESPKQRRAVSIPEVSLDDLQQVISAEMAPVPPAGSPMPDRTISTETNYPSEFLEIDVQQIAEEVKDDSLPARRSRR